MLMRRSNRGTAYKRPRSRITFAESIPAPTRGLNFRDPLGNMDPGYAINLTNFVASPQGVSVRRGFRTWATMDGNVETLMPYRGTTTGGDRLFSAGNGVIWNATAGGSATSVLSGMTRNVWSHLNFAATAGHYLVICNGADAPRHYDGSGWVTWTYVASPSTPGQVGPPTGGGTNIGDVAKFESVISHQRRLWFVERDSSRGWYLDINSIGGGATSFDFGPLFPRGGKLVALTSWSMNGGTGMQNYLVAASSQGDVVIYEGTDPSNASAWSLKGTWTLGAPISNKCFLQHGGDVLYLCQDGLVPLSQNLQSTTNTASLTDAIRSLVSQMTTTFGSLSGWQLQAILSENLLLINVPQIVQANNFQFVFNTITGGWSTFSGWPATCWATLGGSIYFGTTNKVCAAFVGFRDGAAADGTGGSVYTATAQQAFNYFGLDHRGKKKRFIRAKPDLLTTSGTPNILIACNTDFSSDPPTEIGSAIPVADALWGTGIWDSSVWAGSSGQNYNAWQTLGNIGYCASLTISLSVLSETEWIATEWEIELGGSH